MLLSLPAESIYVVAALAFCAGWLHESGMRGINSDLDSARFSPLLALLLFCLAMVGCGPSKTAPREAKDSTAGNSANGKIAIMKYGCIACHTVDGIRESQATTGPPLLRMANRTYLAGNLPNNAANMIRFIQHPHEVHNDTAMPEIGVTDEDARDIAAYLYQFK